MRFKLIHWQGFVAFTLSGAFLMGSVLRVALVNKKQVTPPELRNEPNGA